VRSGCRWSGVCIPWHIECILSYLDTDIRGCWFLRPDNIYLRVAFIFGKESLFISYIVNSGSMLILFHQQAPRKDWRFYVTDWKHKLVYSYPFSFIHPMKMFLCLKPFFSRFNRIMVWLSFRFSYLFTWNVYFHWPRSSLWVGHKWLSWIQVRIILELSEFWFLVEVFFCQILLIFSAEIINVYLHLHSGFAYYWLLFFFSFFLVDEVSQINQIYAI